MKSLLTLEQKIGQCLMVGVNGTTPQDPAFDLLENHIRHGLVGGVILFQDNLVTPPQIQTLTQFLHETALQAPFPLFLALDQEGGAVQRLKACNGYTAYLSAQDVRTTYSPQDAEIYYAPLAHELKNQGFNVNFAPVVDLQGPCPVIGNLGRAFDVDPITVISYAKAFINAHRKQSILTCLKHFPGHGLALGDTHRGLVDITQTFQEKEGDPFDQLIEEKYADMIMVGHLTNRAVDPDLPASLSPHYIGPWLRKRFKYKGVVVSDDFHMGAIFQKYPLEEIILHALNAGVDLLVFSNKKAAAGGIPDFQPDPYLPEKFQSMVMKAIKTGKLSPKVIETSYSRLHSLKKRLHP